MGFRRFHVRGREEDPLCAAFRREAGEHGCVYAVDMSPERRDFTDGGFLGVVEEWMDWLCSVQEADAAYAFWCEGGQGERERFHVHGMVSAGGRMVLPYADMERRMEELLGCRCRVEFGHRYAREVGSSLEYRMKGRRSAGRCLRRIGT